MLVHVQQTTGAPLLWSIFDVVMIVLAIFSFAYLTIRSYQRSGQIMSISEQLVNSPDDERALVATGVVVAVLGILVSFTTNYLPPTSGSSTSGFLLDRLGISRELLGKLNFASFCLAIGGCQAVVTCTYHMLLPLHFTAAGVFFLFATVTLTVDAYLEYTQPTGAAPTGFAPVEGEPLVEAAASHDEAAVVPPGRPALAGTRPASRTPLRVVLKYASVLAMYVCLGLMLLALVTDKSQPRIDRRPPLIVGEYVGIAAFITHTLALIPVLARPEPVVRAGAEIYDFAKRRRDRSAAMW